MSAGRGAGDGAGDGDADRPAAPTSQDYRWTRAFPTRWNDNDVIGHVNNAVYYEAMDTTVTAWLTGPGGYELSSGLAPVVVSSSCRYHLSAVFPDVMSVGLRADRVGRTSVSWGLGIFRERDGALLATGTFVHVVVDAATMRPVPVPDDLRERVVAELGVDGVPRQG